MSRSLKLTDRLAAIIGDHYWDWGEVERHYTRAIALDPNDVTTLRFYSFYLAYTGRPLEALPIAEQACRLDPVSPNARMNLGVVLRLARRPDEAARQFEETLELDPNFSLARRCSDWCTRARGCPIARSQHVQKARELSGARPDIVAFHGYILARAGRQRRSVEGSRRASSSRAPATPSPFLVALVYVGLEDTDRAFEWLERRSRRGHGSRPC